MTEAAVRNVTNPPDTLYTGEEDGRVSECMNGQVKLHDGAERKKRCAVMWFGVEESCDGGWILC